MSNSIRQVINQYHLQTRLFNNVVAGIGDASAQKPLNENTNHIAWLTGHIVSTRYMLATVLGMAVAEPFPELFANGKGMDKSAEYPTMSALTADWKAISDQVGAALCGLTEDALNAKMPRPVPNGDTLGDFISFIVHHEAYTIGQIGISRRFHGLEAMGYN